MATVNWMVVLASYSLMPRRNHGHNMKRIDISNVKGKASSSLEIGTWLMPEHAGLGSTLIFQCFLKIYIFLYEFIFVVF